MKGIPPEIDALMWSLAEEGGPVAQAEFEVRHARYGPELTRRIRMVAELRQAGKAICHRPTFTPRPIRVATTPRWAVGAAVGMAVLAVGAVAYVASSGAPPTTVKPIPQVRIDPPKTPTPEIVREQPPEAPPAIVQKAPETPPQVVPESDKPRRIKVEGQNLTDAIRLVAASANLKLTVAPGFVEQNVTFDYGDIGAMDALKAMGGEYGFSVLEEEEGHVLVVPARPPETDRRVGP